MKKVVTDRDQTVKKYLVRVHKRTGRTYDDNKNGPGQNKRALADCITLRASPSLSVYGYIANYGIYTC